MNGHLKKTGRLAGLFCAAVFLLYGCRPSLEDPVWYDGFDAGQGKLTLSNTENDKSYAADVYDYAGGIPDYAVYAASTADGKKIGTGISPAPVSEVRLKTARDSSRFFGLDGTFLVVITQYNAGGTKEKAFYRAAVPFAGGCAGVDLAQAAVNGWQDPPGDTPPEDPPGGGGGGGTPT
jgi:hypothetical protein